MERGGTKGRDVWHLAHGSGADVARPLTVLALTPSIGGHFFGDVIAGLAREVAGSDGRLVIVETLRAFAPREEAGEQGDFSTPVGWAIADGAVSLTTAVGADYLEALRAAGKPVVLLSSTQIEDVDAPSVRPGNHLGTAAAVEHLVWHGHSRIGFVGNLAQRDIRERYDAYVGVLTSHGLTADPDLVFLAPDNSEAGGAQAAGAVLQATVRPTALMVGTDRNAIGLAGRLRAAGLSLPDDVALVSFDNIPAGTFISPSLTSVEPRFGAEGELASRLVIDAIRGRDVPHETYIPEPTVVVVRESCGCTGESPHVSYGASPVVHSHDIDALPLRETLTDILARDLRSGDASDDIVTAGAIATTVDLAQIVLERADAASSDQIAALVASLRRLTSRPDTLSRFTEVMTMWAQHGDGSSLAPRLAAALWKLQASAYLRVTEVTDAAIVEQYVVDAGLLDTGGADPRDLTWLAGTQVKAAALALWDGPASDDRLRIVGEYTAAGNPPPSSSAIISSKDFPCETLLSAVSGVDREVCVVVPVSTRDHDWGLLAVVAEFDPTTTRERYQHWAALLCAALESQRRDEEVRRSALYDALTGLPNRRLFVHRLEQAIARWKRSGTAYSVLFLDLDGFKLINDSLGHQMGDRVLRAAGDAIVSELREVDTAARFGGDEFVILLADTEPHDAMVAAQRVQRALSQVREFDGHELVTRASVGIASSAVGYLSAEDVLRDADAAMYSAKAVEPGTVAYFDAPMHETAQRRAALAREVVRGLHEGEFEVLYQPIVDLETGRAHRFEALVRWHHPERGFIEPDSFLSDIDETSLMVQLGHWVINEVCAKLAEWVPRVTNVSINISDKEFWSQDLLSFVTAALDKHGLSADCLTLEVTEGVLMKRPEMALRIMNKLHEAGLRLHIDDFGTGYSSLETLHRFPVEAFKIDRSFIQSLNGGDHSGELIGSLIKLGNALGLSVLAEGVETEEQRLFLQDLGCATGQGFLFMRAVTGDRVEDMLDRPLLDISEGAAPQPR